MICQVVKVGSLAHDSCQHNTNAGHRAEYPPATTTTTKATARARANKPYVSRNHVCCEVNPFPTPQAPHYSFPQATYVHHARLQDPHMSRAENRHILLGPAFRCPYHDPRCMSPIGMFGESPSWLTPVVEEMLEHSPTSATIDYSARSVLRICDTRSAARAALLWEWISGPILPLIPTIME